jgi:S-adenosylmethionine decarboxylase
MQSNSNLLGLHVLLTLRTDDISKLKDNIGFIEFIDITLAKNNLMKVGQSSFVFDNSSFTTAFCLMESHICIHTWPDICQLTADVYLCNYSQDNTKKVREIAESIKGYFQAEIISKNEIFR